MGMYDFSLKRGMDRLPKKSIIALISLMFLTTLTVLAQSVPNVSVFSQAQGIRANDHLGMPDMTVESRLDTIDMNPGDGICADSAGKCTLRAAIMESNALPLTQTIYVPAGTYLLTIRGTDEDDSLTGDLDISDTVLIIGDGQNETIVDANGLDRVFHITDYKTELERQRYGFDMPQLSNMTIQGGNAPYGGGILVDLNDQTLFRHVTLRDNYAYGQHPCGQSAGAALYSTGYLARLNYSDISENRTPSTDLVTQYGALGGHIDLNVTSVVNNETDWAVVFDDNICNDVYDAGSVYQSLIANNRGGAIYANNFISVNDSTITNNAVGVVIDHPHSATRDTYIWKSTIADNGLFGIKFGQATGLDIDTSIVSGHVQDCDTGIYLNFLVVADGGDNLFGDASCTTRDPDTFRNTDPQLLPLADNGGYTMTRAVAPTSPAILPHPFCLRGDQRGPVPYTGQCTIGAYEAKNGGTDFPPFVYWKPNGPEDMETPDSIPVALSKYLYVTFNLPMYDPPGHSDPYDITNPINYLMVMTGTNAGFQSVACGGTVLTHEIAVPIVDVVYGEPWPVGFADTETSHFFGSQLFIEFDAQTVGGNEYYLPGGDYTLYICDDVRNSNGIRLDGEVDRFSGTHYVYHFTNTVVPKPQVFQIDTYDTDTQSSSTIFPNSEPLNLSSAVDGFEIQFSVRMDGYTLIDSKNVQLIQGGTNHSIETSTCDTLSGDDALIPFSLMEPGHYHNVFTDQWTPFAPFNHLRLAFAQPLSANSYRLLLCDDILSWEHIPFDGDSNNNPGGSFALDFGVDGVQPESLPIPSAPTLIDYSDVLVAMSLPAIDDLATSTVIQVERTTAETPVLVDSVDAGTTSFVDSNLTCETDYRYRIRLYDPVEANFSEWSGYLDVTTARCSATLQHTFGLYKEGQWLFYAVDGNQRDDVRFAYGPSEMGWTALVGDWNGDGKPGIGLYKDSVFMLRELDGENVVDRTFNFGPTSNATPIVGDWDGNGTDTVGVFDSGTFHLRNNNSVGLADLVFSLGTSSSTPLAGDWDGDGTDSVGYFENNTFYLASSGTTPDIYTSFGFGPSGWAPVSGDWDGDLFDSIGLYNNGLWRLRNNNSSGVVDYGFSYGDLASGWQPLSFEGDTSILNRLFAATVPTPRVPVIPGPDQPQSSGLGQLTWTREFVNLRGTGCPMGPFSALECADWYFRAISLPSTSSSFSFVGIDNYIAYPYVSKMWAAPGAENLDYDLTAGRWTATTSLVGSLSEGAQITPGIYELHTKSDDGVRLRYEVASGSCMIPSTPTTLFPLAGQYWNIIDNWTHHGTILDTGRIKLDSGCSYLFELQWFNGAGSSTIMLDYGESDNPYVTPTNTPPATISVYTPTRAPSSTPIASLTPTLTRTLTYTPSPTPSSTLSPSTITPTPSDTPEP
ncbi:MAG: hypothetical protein CL607_17835 [Anaerolineaceae bacterium]|nr:hypothetical protein [Anaerolineaceae bacterium]